MSLKEISRLEDIQNKILDKVEQIENKLDNHLEHHKFLEQMNSLKREWIRWAIPICLTLLIFALQKWG